MARCLCERLYGVWSVERRDVRSGETRVFSKEGVRNVDIPHHRMSVPWCQHQRPGASRSLASCSACAAVRCCSGEPGSAVSHGPAGRAADTNTGSLKPSSGNEINYSKLLLSLNFRVQLAILKQKLDTEELYLRVYFWSPLFIKLTQLIQ